MELRSFFIFLWSCSTLPLASIQNTFWSKSTRWKERKKGDVSDEWRRRRRQKRFRRRIKSKSVASPRRERKKLSLRRFDELSSELNPRCSFEIRIVHRLLKVSNRAFLSTERGTNRKKWWWENRRWVSERWKESETKIWGWISHFTAN